MKIKVSPKEGFTLIELLVVISIIAILAGIALPAFTQVIEKGNQTKVLSNAKQIYLGLKMFAGDYDGVFPTKGPDNDGNLNTEDGITNSNRIYANLIPSYIQQEKIFHVAKSGWCNAAAPDEAYNNNTQKLAAGENHFAYVKGLNDTSNPNYPLIADGMEDVANPNKWTNLDNAKGAIWKGKSAVVVRVDGSGEVKRLNAQFILAEKAASTNGETLTNIFVPTANWMGTATEVLNPLAPAGADAD